MLYQEDDHSKNLSFLANLEAILYPYTTKIQKTFFLKNRRGETYAHFCLKLQHIPTFCPKITTYTYLFVAKITTYPDYINLRWGGRVTILWIFHKFLLHLWWENEHYWKLSSISVKFCKFFGLYSQSKPLTQTYFIH